MSINLILVVAILVSPFPLEMQRGKARARAKARPAAKSVNLGGLVTADPLPSGYKATVTEKKEGDKVAAHFILVSKEGAGAQSVISIEERELTSRPAMVAATKGYINGTAQALQGVKLVKKEIPDLATVDFKERQTVNLVFQKPEGPELNIQLQILFTTKGYNIQIVGENKPAFDTLTAWAKSIKPL